MIQIKKTKSIYMSGDETQVRVVIDVGDGKHYNDIYIPVSKAFSVQRGIVSYIQKFYRKHK